MYLFTYVDDIVVARFDQAQFERLLMQWARNLHSKDRRTSVTSWGYNLKDARRDCIYHNKHYLVNLLKSCELDNLKPSSTLIVVQKPVLKGGNFRINRIQKDIGSLQYLTLSQPDIQYAVIKLSQFMSSPKSLHWAAMKKILMSKEIDIILGKVSNYSISRLCDADQVGDTTDRKKPGWSPCVCGGNTCFMVLQEARYNNLIKHGC